MNALHAQSERAFMAKRQQRQQSPKQLTRVVSQEVDSKPHVVPFRKIAIERIKWITVKRSSLAEYTVATETDFKSFRDKFGSAMFVWCGNSDGVGGCWRLFEPVGELQSATIQIKL